MRTRSHSRSESGPGFIQILVETPTGPTSWSNPARRMATTSASGMTERIRRLHISEVGYCLTGSVELRLREGGTCSRLQREHHLPGWLFLNPCQQVRCLLAEMLDYPGDVGSPLAFLCHRNRCLHAAQAVKDDNVLSHDHDAYSMCDVLPLERSGESSTIPALVRLDDGTLNGILES